MSRDPGATPVIVDGLRTPFGRYGGALKEARPDDLAAHVIRRWWSGRASTPAQSTT